MGAKEKGLGGFALNLVLLGRGMGGVQRRACCLVWAEVSGVWSYLDGDVGKAVGTHKPQQARLKKAVGRRQAVCR